MSKLLLLSIIFSMIFFPTRAAREKNAQKGFEKALKHVFFFNLFYLAVLLFLYGRV